MSIVTLIEIMTNQISGYPIAPLELRHIPEFMPDPTINTSAENIVDIMVNTFMIAFGDYHIDISSIPLPYRAESLLYR
jgi:hypothetical protein